MVDPGWWAVRPSPPLKVQSRSWMNGTWGSQRKQVEWNNDGTARMLKWNRINECTGLLGKPQVLASLYGNGESPFVFPSRAHPCAVTWSFFTQAVHTWTRTRISWMGFGMFWGNLSFSVGLWNVWNPLMITFEGA